MQVLASLLVLAAAVDVLPGPARRATPRPTPPTSAQEQVRARERAFARTMADRDHAAFTSFLSQEAVFQGGSDGAGVLRGRQAVAEGWKRFFEGPKAPFSWAPELVEVIDSGTLALSRGPVFDPAGTRSGTFTSTWRKERDGEWRIVLDSGCPPCRCTEQPSAAKERH